MWKEDFKGAVGFSIGPSNCFVGVCVEKKFEIITDEFFNPYIPSLVAFSQDKILVGESARLQLSQNPFNTISGTTRILGKSFDHPVVQEEIKKSRNRIIPKNSSLNHEIPVYEIIHGNEKKIFTPEQILKFIFSYLKTLAGKYLKKNVHKAVVTVPTFWNDEERESISSAARSSGLNVIRCVNESTSICLAIPELMKKTEEEVGMIFNVLVFDFGGRSIDVTVVVVEDVIFEISATSSDNNFGGEQVTELLLEYVLENIRKRYPNISEEVLSDESSKSQLRSECENAKKDLSIRMRTVIEIENIFQTSINYKLQISRAQFESIIPFRKILTPIVSAIENSIISNTLKNKSDFHHVIIAGASSKIPKVRELIKDYFPSNECIIHCEDDCDLLCVRGASLLANKLTNSPKLRMMIEVIPLSLGLEIQEGKMKKILPRNSCIPIQKSINLKIKDIPSEGEKNNVLVFSIFEGEGKLVKDNFFMEKFKVEIDGADLIGEEKMIDIFFVVENGYNFVVRVIDENNVVLMENEIVSLKDLGRLTHEMIAENIKKSSKEEEED